jgi:hypothetical protein
MGATAAEGAADAVLGGSWATAVIIVSSRQGASDRGLFMSGFSLAGVARQASFPAGCAFRRGYLNHCSDSQRLAAVAAGVPCGILRHLVFSTKWPTKFADKVSKRRHNENAALWLRASDVQIYSDKN